MTDNPMVIRVARAIAAATGTKDWESVLPAARAAILAMREPTPGMLDAAAEGLPDWGHLPDDWRAMIDHAASQRAA